MYLQELKETSYFTNPDQNPSHPFPQLFALVKNVTQFHVSRYVSYQQRRAPLHDQLDCAFQSKCHEAWSPQLEELIGSLKMKTQNIKI